LLAHVTQQGYAVNALTFRYGQRHEMEIERARRIAEHYAVARHVVTEIDLRLFGGSALTGDEAVPKGRGAAAIAQGIPVTYVPARNTIFLSFALAWAEALGAFEIFIGVNALDYSGYPDCRPEYIRAFEALANLATRAAVERAGRFAIRAPLMDFGKRQIIELGRSLGVDYGMTLSCYDPALDGTACGACDACALRRRGFSEAGAVDPQVYAQ